MVFDRRVDGATLTFGVSGMLRDSNLIMWDRQTESWWQQGTFQAIVGQHAGAVLDVIPAHLTGWADFRDTYPNATVLEGPLASLEVYGYNPYFGYDTAAAPFLFEGEVDGPIPPLARVVGLTLGGEPIAYPFKALSLEPVLYQVIGGREIVLLFEEATTSPVDSSAFSESRAVGSVGVFLPVVDGQRLTLRRDGRVFIDQETGSTWNVLGKAIAGDLQGKSLPPVFHSQPFWFYWKAAHPNTAVYRPEVFQEGS